MSSTKRALLIGINYIKSPNARLYGCIEDIKNVQNMLMDAYGYAAQNITVLRDDDGNKMPTKANILLALQSIIAASRASDEIWLHYSGHGTQVRDTNGDEADRLDEAIVPVDYLTAGMISDDDLFNLVRSIRCRAFLVFDSCHSGSVCDLQYSINYVNGSFAKSISSSKSIANPNIVLLSGCRDAQTSADAYDDTAKEPGGALSISLVDALRKNGHNVDILKVYNDVCYGLISAKYQQIPVLSSSAALPSWRFARPSVVQAASPLTTTPKPSSPSLASKSVSLVPRNIYVGPPTVFAFSGVGRRQTRMGMNL
jgi:hypothetical protein